MEAGDEKTVGIKMNEGMKETLPLSQDSERTPLPK